MSEDWGHDDCEVRAADRETGDTAPLEGSAAMWRQRAKSAEAELLALRCKPTITDYSELDIRWQELVAAHDQLRAKLQAAETRADAMERAGAEQACRADQNQTDMLGWCSRAEAAEARVAELEARETRLREALGHHARHHWQCNAFNPSQRDREEGRDKCDCNGKTAIEALEVKP